MHVRLRSIRFCSDGLRGHFSRESDFFAISTARIGLCAEGIGWLRCLEMTALLDGNGRPTLSGGAGRANRPRRKNIRWTFHLHWCPCDFRRETCRRKNNSSPGDHIWRRLSMFICRTDNLRTTVFSRNRPADISAISSSSSSACRHAAIFAIRPCCGRA